MNFHLLGDASGLTGWKHTSQTPKTGAPDYHRDTPCADGSGMRTHEQAKDKAEQRPNTVAPCTETFGSGTGSSAYRASVHSNHHCCIAKGIGARFTWHNSSVLG